MNGLARVIRTQVNNDTKVQPMLKTLKIDRQIETASWQSRPRSKSSTEMQ